MGWNWGSIIHPYSPFSDTQIEMADSPCILFEWVGWCWIMLDTNIQQPLMKSGLSCTILSLKHKLLWWEHLRREKPQDGNFSDPKVFANLWKMSFSNFYPEKKMICLLHLTAISKSAFVEWWQTTTSAPVHPCPIPWTQQLLVDCTVRVIQRKIEIVAVLHQPAVEVAMVTGPKSAKLMIWQFMTIASWDIRSNFKCPWESRGLQGSRQGSNISWFGVSGSFEQAFHP